MATSEGYRFTFESNSRQHNCPECGKKKYRRYIDRETGMYLPIEYGWCNRTGSCGYEQNPYKSGYAKEVLQKERSLSGCLPIQPSSRTRSQESSTTTKTVFIPEEVLRQTRIGYDKNIFVQNLLKRVAYPFDKEDIERVADMYRLGTVPDTGAVCFPFIDKDNQVRAIQEKIFDFSNHTDKNRKFNTSWIHSRLKNTVFRKGPVPAWLDEYDRQETKVSCLFGEHLLSLFPINPVALVEAPKTAVCATLYFGFPETPRDLIWLAVYNKSSFSSEKLSVLKGKDVAVFPDLSKDGSTYLEWQVKAKKYERQLPGTRFVFSDLLERHAPANDRVDGFDIADYLLRLDWRKFRTQSEELSKPAEIPICVHPNEQASRDIVQMNDLSFEIMQSPDSLSGLSDRRVRRILAAIPANVRLNRRTLRTDIAVNERLQGLHDADIILDELIDAGKLMGNTEFVWKEHQD